MDQLTETELDDIAQRLLAGVGNTEREARLLIAAARRANRLTGALERIRDGETPVHGLPGQYYGHAQVIASEALEE
jgi:hypothetical protein